MDFVYIGLLVEHPEVIKIGSTTCHCYDRQRNADFSIIGAVEFNGSVYYCRAVEKELLNIYRKLYDVYDGRQEYFDSKQIIKSLLQWKETARSEFFRFIEILSYKYPTIPDYTEYHDSCILGNY